MIRKVIINSNSVIEIRRLHRQVNGDLLEIKWLERTSIGDEWIAIQTMLVPFSHAFELAKTIEAY